MQRRVPDLEARAASSDLWEQPAQAQALLQELTALRESLAEMDRFEGMLGDVDVAVDLLQMDEEVWTMRMPCVCLSICLSRWRRA
jgi:hypothetical protein